MPATYEPIATTTLSSASNTIDFTSITSSYTDLRLIFAVSSVNSDNWARLRFNSDTGTNYSQTYITGDGTSASASTTTSFTNLLLGYPSNVYPGLFIVDILSYAGSTYKSCLISEAQDNNGSGQTRGWAGYWRSTSAITSINIYFSGLTYSAGTTATLYGILKA